MGWYATHVLPRLLNKACETRDLVPWRRKVVEGLAGRVVEVGFGSGLNLPFYPDEVELVYAVEPSLVAWKLSEGRLEMSSIPVIHVGSDGEGVSLPDASCDRALSTFTLCTIPDVARALSELRRVLRPGGRLHFLEHGLSPDPGVARWQRRLDPLQRRLVDGCHLTREPAALVERAGFEISRLEQGYSRGARPWTWYTVGLAVNPG